MAVSKKRKKHIKKSSSKKNNLKLYSDFIKENAFNFIVSCFNFKSDSVDISNISEGSLVSYLKDIENSLLLTNRSMGYLIEEKCLIQSIDAFKDLIVFYKKENHSPIESAEFIVSRLKSIFIDESFAIKYSLLFSETLLLDENKERSRFYALIQSVVCYMLLLKIKIKNQYIDYIHIDSDGAAHLKYSSTRIFDMFELNKVSRRILDESIKNKLHSTILMYCSLNTFKVNHLDILSLVDSKPINVHINKDFSNNELLKLFNENIPSLFKKERKFIYKKDRVSLVLVNDRDIESINIFEETSSFVVDIKLKNNSDIFVDEKNLYTKDIYNIVITIQKDDLNASIIQNSFSIKSGDSVSESYEFFKKIHAIAITAIYTAYCNQKTYEYIELKSVDGEALECAKVKKLPKGRYASKDAVLKAISAGYRYIPKGYTYLGA